MASDSISLIAKRYARAWFALGQDESVLEALARDAASVKEALAQSDDLVKFIANPLLSRAQKAQGVEAVLAKLGAHALTRKFFRTLSDNRRLSALPAILAEVEKLIAAHSGVMEVEILAAKPLNEAQVGALTAALSKAYHKRVQATQRQDAALLGGFILNIGGLMMDYSLAGKLKRLQASLKGAVQA